MYESLDTCESLHALMLLLLQGPILRTIQRFGKLGRRSGKGNENTMKDTKYMFISIDEAGSHVRVKHFR